MSKKLKPDFEEGFVEIPITYEDVYALIKSLEYAADAFQHLFEEATSQGDPQLGDLFKARGELCTAFADKFSAVAKVGQPSDNSKH